MLFDTPDLVMVLVKLVNYVPEVILDYIFPWPWRLFYRWSALKYNEEPHCFLARLTSYNPCRQVLTAE